RQNQYLRYRRLFMDIEREQVKEQQRQKERQKKIAKIKSEKEHQRRAEEQRIQEMAYQQDTCSGEKACEVLAQLRLEERRVRKSKEKQQRNKEYMRYMEALRAQMREKIKLYNIDLPPLCCCGSDFWDSHPDTCANNCMFYKNHKGSRFSVCPVPTNTSQTPAMVLGAFPDSYQVLLVAYRKGPEHLSWLLMLERCSRSSHHVTFRMGIQPHDLQSIT
ncbi:hypothetical protein KIL84_008261, partial [Mauremys mutica]